jgi:hypothetical protein
MRDVAIGAVCAALLVAAISLITTPVENLSQYDGRSYVRMAGEPFLAYDKIPAPFAYRPGVPALVHWMTSASPIGVAAAYRLLAHLAAFAVLALCFAIARDVGASQRSALLAMSAAALAHYHVRGPLFFYSLIEVESLSLVMLAMLLLWRERQAACLAVGAVGLLVKEWLLIPAVIACFELLRQGVRTRDARSWLTLGIGVAAIVACIAWPRWVATPPRSFSSLDRIDSVASFFSLVGEPRKLSNFAFVVASYGLPLWMLVTRERVRALGQSLSGKRAAAALYCALVFAFTLLGGTNQMIFITYTLPVQTIVLACFLDDSAGWEIGLVLLALFVFNNFWAPVPELTQAIPSLHEWADFYGGWGKRLSASTGYRALEILAFVGAANLGRHLMRDRAPG